jgi:EamA domain-containing membrane protein RarD
MTFESLLIGSLSGVIVLFIINGFKFEFTIFTFIMSLLTALNSFGFTYCSFKALGHINLSKFSLFSMLGGMLLPFIQGILFYNEPLTTGKILCFVIIVFSLFLTVK